MKPENNKARRSSFIKFLLLFVFTVAVIIAAIFFTFKMPVAENKILTDQSITFKEDMKFQNLFSEKIESTKKLIDSLSTPGANTSFLNGVISQDLVKTQSLVQDQIKKTKKKSKFDHNMYFEMINLLVESQKMKSKLNELRNAEQAIDEYKDALEETKSNLEDTERDLSICRSSN